MIMTVNMRFRGDGGVRRNGLELLDSRLVPADAQDDIREWVAAWLLGFARANTRRAYAGDIPTG
jgi:hypothetical protein